MLDKGLIQKNFKKSLKTYDNNAIIQKKMAKRLLSLVKSSYCQKKFKNILEIGSFTGILTKEIIKNFEFESYLALDIIDSFDFIKDLNDKITFQKTDIESFETNEKFDLIISNASLQWCDDFFNVIDKLKSYLKKDGVLAFSTFGQKNLFEIKTVFNSGLKYYSIDEIKENIQNAKIEQNIETLKFNNPIEILKHLKLTGVNSISKNQLKISEIKEKLKRLNSDFNNNLTYDSVFVVLN